MNRYNDEERQRILAEARETLSRPLLHSAAREERREDSTAASDPPVDQLSHVTQLESRSERHIRELEQQEQQFARERAARKRDEDAERKRIARGYADQVAVRRIAELEEQLCEIVRNTTTVIEAHENEIARVTRENAELKVKLIQLETVIGELRLEARGDRKAIDLPLRSVN